MAAPENNFAFDLDAMTQAAEHWRGRQHTREQQAEHLKHKQYVDAEPKERLAKRANRLIDKVRDTVSQDVLSSAPTALSDELMELVERGAIQEDEISNALMERVIGETRDFLSVEFLSKAIRASRCVGRIVTRLDRGRVSYGTGFMVSPRLLLTNHHVLTSGKEAAVSDVEFDYQLDMAGARLTTQRFALEPDVFFLNDKRLDFALVAVRETSEQGKPLKDYGWLPLIKDEGKIILKDCVNIIQHPRGELKQVVIRENELIDLLDSGFAHYRGDTEPGSSGSPAFNDQWEVVALHHSGVPKMNEKGEFLTNDDRVWRKGDDPAQLAWVANEGIRVSRIVQFLEKSPLRKHELELMDQLLKGPSPLPIDPPTGNGHLRKLLDGGNGHAGRTNGKKEPGPAPGLASEKPDTGGGTMGLRTTADGTVTFTIPLGITIRVGDAGALSVTAEADAPADALAEEKVEPDPDYSNRPGYDPNFLGFPVPMPKLANAIRNQAFNVPDAVGPNRNELKYYHYSVILNRLRRVAFVSAVNIWANAPFNQKRDKKDTWFIDPRVPLDAQTSERLYQGNPLDRGHLTRRDDAAWGQTAQEAKLANDDTFHFPNCSPQHEIFNQSAKASSRGLRLWGNLENHISEQAEANDRKITVFNGPIFRPDDRVHRGIRIPREYWKIVVLKKDNGEPTALAFILSQESLIKDLPTQDFAEDFVVGEYQPFQVKVRDLEAKTKLDFGALRTFDPLENDVNQDFFEVDTDVVPLLRLSDIIS